MESIPVRDETYEEARQVSKAWGLSWDEFVRLGAKHFRKELDDLAPDEDQEADND